MPRPEGKAQDAWIQLPPAMCNRPDDFGKSGCIVGSPTMLGNSWILGLVRRRIPAETKGALGGKSKPRVAWQALAREAIAIEEEPQESPRPGLANASPTAPGRRAHPASHLRHLLSPHISDETHRLCISENV